MHWHADAGGTCLAVAAKSHLPKLPRTRDFSGPNKGISPVANSFAYKREDTAEIQPGTIGNKKEINPRNPPEYKGLRGLRGKGRNRLTPCALYS